MMTLPLNPHCQQRIFFFFFFLMKRDTNSKQCYMPKKIAVNLCYSFNICACNAQSRAFFSVYFIFFFNSLKFEIKHVIFNVLKKEQ